MHALIAVNHLEDCGFQAIILPFSMFFSPVLCHFLVCLFHHVEVVVVSSLALRRQVVYHARTLAKAGPLVVYCTTANVSSHAIKRLPSG